MTEDECLDAELREYITAEDLFNFLQESFEDGKIRRDAPIVVDTADGMCGVGVGISNMGYGMDFTQGNLVLYPMYKLYKNIRRFENPAGFTTEFISGAHRTACGKCHLRVSPRDDYCKHCGQRLR